MTESANRQLVDMLDQVWGSMADLGSTLDETEWKQPTECPGGRCRTTSCTSPRSSGSSSVTPSRPRTSPRTSRT